MQSYVTTIEPASSVVYLSQINMFFFFFFFFFFFYMESAERQLPTEHADVQLQDDGE